MRFALVAAGAVVLALGGPLGFAGAADAPEIATLKAFAAQPAPTPAAAPKPAQRAQAAQAADCPGGVCGLGKGFQSGFQSEGGPSACGASERRGPLRRLFDRLRNR